MKWQSRTIAAIGITTFLANREPELAVGLRAHGSQKQLKLMGEKVPFASNFIRVIVHPRRNLE